jgi:hypothetical protein
MPSSRQHTVTFIYTQTTLTCPLLSGTLSVLETFLFLYLLSTDLRQLKPTFLPQGTQILYFLPAAPKGETSILFRGNNSSSRVC